MGSIRQKNVYKISKSFLNNVTGTGLTPRPTQRSPRRIARRGGEAAASIGKQRAVKFWPQ